jgi:hypothetical protein
MKLTRTVDIKGYFGQFLMTKLEVYEDQHGVIVKIQIWSGFDPLASMLSQPSLPGALSIKNYAENEGLLDALVAAEIVGHPLSGSKAISICKLLV